jgi:hypothetical protein
MEGYTQEVCDLLELKGVIAGSVNFRSAIIVRNRLNKADDHRLRYSEGFPDPVKLGHQRHDGAGTSRRAPEQRRVRRLNRRIYRTTRHSSRALGIGDIFFLKRR